VVGIDLSISPSRLGAPELPDNLCAPSRLLPVESSRTLSFRFLFLLEPWSCSRLSHTDVARIADNVRRTVELTELGLALRLAVLQQLDPQGTYTMTQVMHEIRLAKEQAWRQS